jgi:tRNA(Arg) A34 adenosine deaminase TadA
MKGSDLVFSMPPWLEDFINEQGRLFPSREDRMRFAIDLSEMNVTMKTGGPFGAAVFEKSGGKLIAAGVNRVVSAACSFAHAEMMAIGLAQKFTGHFDLGGPGRPACELVTSTEPCAMCLGAIPWSGLRGLVCGARDEDARSLGFDEGAKPDRWTVSLEERGIAVARDVMRAEARRILKLYVEQGGLVYNARQG